MVLENETLDLARDKKEPFSIFIKSLVETQMQQDPMASSAPCTTIFPNSLSQSLIQKRKINWM